MRWRTLAGLALLSLCATAPGQQVSEPELPGGVGGGTLRLCWHECDPEGRIGPALGADGSEVWVRMRNGQGRLFLILPCDRLADPGFRSPP